MLLEYFQMLCLNIILFKCSNIYSEYTIICQYSSIYSGYFLEVFYPNLSSRYVYKCKISFSAPLMRFSFRFIVNYQPSGYIDNNYACHAPTLKTLLRNPSVSGCHRVEIIILFLFIKIHRTNVIRQNWATFPLNTFEILSISLKTR